MLYLPPHLAVGGEYGSIGSCVSVCECSLLNGDRTTRDDDDDDDEEDAEEDKQGEREVKERKGRVEEESLN